MAQSWREETVPVAGADLTMIKGGSGKPLLMLHDELGFPGWMTWNETLAHDRTFVIPLQPGYGKSPKQAWIRSYRDLGGFYAQAIRQLKLDPIDVIGFSAGGFAAAEMAARIGWEPYMHNPSLPHLLHGLSLPTLLVWGTADKVVPRGCIELYKKSIAGAQVVEIEGAGHRPEIENSPTFEGAVTRFLAA